MSGRDGGPAFPFQATDRDSGYAQEPHPGMTLRDYFAGQALAGYLANPEALGAILRVGENIASDDDMHQAIADLCYEHAEALIEERERDR